MRRARAPLASLLVAAVLTGCVKTTISPFAGAAPGAPVPPDSVVVYRTAAAVPRAYEQLAVVSARGDFTVVNEAKLIRALRAEAGRLGANGLLLAAVQAPHGAAKVAGALYGGELGLRRGQAVAIRVRPDSTAAR